MTDEREHLKTELDCCRNQLTELDLSNVPNLTVLYCLDNQLTDLDLSNLPKLTDLDCGDNELTKLDLSNMGELKKLWCDDNQLTDLNLSNVPNLTHLICEQNQLTDLDIRNCLHLEEVMCDSWVRINKSPNQNVKVRFMSTNERKTKTLGYLAQIKADHKKYGHEEQAKVIVEQLRSEFPRLQVDNPIEWQGGRYWGVFIPLIPNRVRLIIQLTSSGTNRHVYNLKPTSQRQPDVKAFETFMKEKNIKVKGTHAKLPCHKSQKSYSNEDIDAIKDQVRATVKEFDIGGLSGIFDAPS